MLSEIFDRIITTARDPLYAHVLPLAEAVQKVRGILLEASSSEDLRAADFQEIAAALREIQRAINAAAEIDVSP